MDAAKDIGLVIVGAAGYRGKSALEMLPKLSADVKAQGINLELVCLAEAREESRAELADYLSTRLACSRPVVGTLIEAIPYALRWLAEGQDQRKLIVYDAAPTAHHYLHLMTILPHSEREHIYYFGEKPLFTKEAQTDFVAHNFPRPNLFFRIH